MSIALNYDHIKEKIKSEIVKDFLKKTISLSTVSPLDSKSNSKDSPLSVLLDHYFIKVWATEWFLSMPVLCFTQREMRAPAAPLKPF